MCDVLILHILVLIGNPHISEPKGKFQNSNVIIYLSFSAVNMPLTRLSPTVISVDLFSFTYSDIRDSAMI